MPMGDRCGTPPKSRPTNQNAAAAAGGINSHPGPTKQNLSPRGPAARRLSSVSQRLWIAQRLPLVEIRANARQNWGITNVRTVSRYLSLARQRMVEELIQNRLQHQAEQIYGLNELIHQAACATQSTREQALRHPHGG